VQALLTSKIGKDVADRQLRYFLTSIQVNLLKIDHCNRAKLVGVALAVEA